MKQGTFRPANVERHSKIGRTAGARRARKATGADRRKTAVKPNLFGGVRRAAMVGWARPAPAVAVCRGGSVEMDAGRTRGHVGRRSISMRRMALMALTLPFSAACRADDATAAPATPEAAPVAPAPETTVK